MKIRGTTINTPIARHAVPDDTMVSRKPWSSKNTVDKLCPSFTEQGAIVSCEPVESYPLHIVGGIKAVQNGSGNPSPENIRPIKGWDAMTVTQTGKNIIPFPYSAKSKTENGMTYTVMDGGGVFVSGEPTAQSNFHFYGYKNWTNCGFLKAGEYVFSISGDYTAVGSPFVYAYSTSKGVLGGINLATSNSVSFAVTEDLQDVAIYTVFHNTGYCTGTIYPQLEIGSAKTAYEPYRGSTITIPLGQTVYGGNYDCQTGELKQSRVAIVLNGTEQWFLNSATYGQCYIYHNIANCANWGEIDCSHFIGSNDGAYNSKNGHISSGTKLLWICDNRFTTLDSWKTYLAEQYAAGTPVTVVVSLTEPIVTQLEPVEIPALSGVNKISADSGYVTVSGRSVSSSQWTVLENMDEANPIVLCTLPTGMYFLKGYFKLSPSSAPLEYWEFMAVLTQDPEDMNLHLHCPAVHAIHHYRVNRTTYEASLTRTYFDKICEIDEIASKLANMLDLTKTGKQILSGAIEVTGNIYAKSSLQMYGNINMAGGGGTKRKVYNLAEPTSASDAATKKYVDNALANAIAAAIEEGLSE